MHPHLSAQTHAPECAELGRKLKECNTGSFIAKMLNKCVPLKNEYLECLNRAHEKRVEASRIEGRKNREMLKQIKKAHRQKLKSQQESAENVLEAKIRKLREEADNQ